MTWPRKEAACFQAANRNKPNWGCLQQVHPRAGFPLISDFSASSLLKLPASHPLNVCNALAGQSAPAAAGAAALCKASQAEPSPVPRPARTAASGCQHHLTCWLLRAASRCERKREEANSRQVSTAASFTPCSEMSRGSNVPSSASKGGTCGWVPGGNGDGVPGCRSCPRYSCAVAKLPLCMCVCMCISRYVCVCISRYIDAYTHWLRQQKCLRTHYGHIYIEIILAGQCHTDYLVHSVSLQHKAMSSKSLQLHIQVLCIWGFVGLNSKYGESG